MLGLLSGAAAAVPSRGAINQALVEEKDWDRWLDDGETRNLDLRCTTRGSNLGLWPGLWPELGVGCGVRGGGAADGALPPRLESRTWLDASAYPRALRSVPRHCSPLHSLMASTDPNRCRLQPC